MKKGKFRNFMFYELCFLQILIINSHLFSRQSFLKLVKIDIPASLSVICLCSSHVQSIEKQISKSILAFLHCKRSEKKINRELKEKLRSKITLTSNPLCSFSSYPPVSSSSPFFQGVDQYQ